MPLSQAPRGRDTQAAAMSTRPRRTWEPMGMQIEPAQHPVQRVSHAFARTRLLVSMGAGLAAGALAAALNAGRPAPLVGWDVMALMYCGWVWACIWPMESPATARHANREDPGRDLADLVLLGAAIASLAAVGLVLFGADHDGGNAKYLEAAFAVVSVFVSWALVHTVFTLKYARLYYAGRAGGIDFNEPEDPQYSDFAYLAFTIGMTFQVSDTDIKSKAIRRTALRHACLSFPLGSVIIAALINLVAGLAK